MAGLGFPEIMVILIVALVVFGPRKLPELGKSLGAGLREFRSSTQGLKDEFEGIMKDSDPAAAASQTIVNPAQVTVLSAQPQVIQAPAAQPQPQPQPQVVRAQDVVAPQPQVAASQVAASQAVSSHENS